MTTGDVVSLGAYRSQREAIEETSRRDGLTVGEALDEQSASIEAMIEALRAEQREANELAYLQAEFGEALVRRALRDIARARRWLAESESEFVRGFAKRVAEMPLREYLEALDARPESEVEPEPEPEPEVEPKPEEEPEPEAEPARGEPPRWGLDVTPAFGVLVGLVPTDFESRLGGGGGELIVHGRSPRDVLVGGAVRVYGREDGIHDLLRVRVGASVGYVWSFAKAEVLAGGTVGFTSWSVRRRGERLPAADFGAQSTLLSAAGWVAGGPRFALDRRRLRAIRVGGRLELGGGFALQDGVRAVALFDAEGNDLFRIGGIELTMGLDVALSFGGGAATRR